MANTTRKTRAGVAAAKTFGEARERYLDASTLAGDMLLVRNGEPSGDAPLVMLRPGETKTVKAGTRVVLLEKIFTGEVRPVSVQALSDLTATGPLAYSEAAGANVLDEIEEIIKPTPLECVADLVVPAATCAGLALLILLPAALNIPEDGAARTLLPAVVLAGLATLFAWACRNFYDTGREESRQALKQHRPRRLVVRTPDLEGLGSTS